MGCGSQIWTSPTGTWLRLAAFVLQCCSGCIDTPFYVGPWTGGVVFSDYLPNPFPGVAGQSHL